MRPQVFSRICRRDKSCLQTILCTSMRYECWGDVGLLAILKFLLKRYFDRQGYEEVWRQHYNLEACYATLISEAVKL